MDIFCMGDQNSGNLRERYESLRRKYESQGNASILDSFTEFVEEKWTVSVNMDLLAIYDLLISGKYKNVYEVKGELAQELRRHEGLGVSLESALKGHLKSYYRPTTAFDRAFKNGEKFRYGALNIGGLGAYKYGEFCVVFGKKQVREYSALVFIKQDSLKYVNSNVLDIEQLLQDTANKECIHLLVALKHEGYIESTPDHRWPSMVCCSEDYVEAITTDDILDIHIGTVRTSKKFIKPYFDNLFRFYASEPLDDFTKYELSLFRYMLRFLDERGIELEELNEDGD
jgi:hypothetical protein